MITTTTRSRIRRTLAVTAVSALGATGLLFASSGTANAAAAYTCNGLKATIVGTNGSNEIEGTRGRDVIVALGGHDEIDGNGGNDVICAGAGHDVVEGGSGNDWISGGSGNDHLEGDSGKDKLYGNSGYDLLEGGTGSDKLSGGADRDWLAQRYATERVEDRWEDRYSHDD